MRLLIGTDGTDLSLAAAAKAWDLVAALRPATDVEIHLVTVVPDVADPEEYAGGFEGPLGTSEQVEEMRRAQRVDADGALARTARATGNVPMVETVLEADHTGRALAEHAEHIAADMVVVGSHGRNALQRAVLGSVTNYLLKHSPCPVLVIPRPGDTDRDAAAARAASPAVD